MLKHRLYTSQFPSYYHDVVVGQTFGWQHEGLHTQFLEGFGKHRLNTSQFPTYYHDIVVSQTFGWELEGLGKHQTRPKGTRWISIDIFKDLQQTKCILCHL